MTTEIIKRIEKCPFDSYCLKEARFTDVRVCKGLEGDYRDCVINEQYMRRDLIRDINRTCFRLPLIDANQNVSA